MPPSTSDDGPSVAALDKTDLSNRHPRRGSYPPISSIPYTSVQRLTQAAEDAAPVGDADASDTVLYLAYGSNLSAETFLGMRKIRPLSQMNVSVPILQLTFDLPGVPYREPCFANVGFRDGPESERRGRPTAPAADPTRAGYEWDGHLMGVVYEVTQKDWRTIMRTEGAGSSYKEVAVPCIPLRSTLVGDAARPNRPPSFLARTLYASYVPDGGDDDAGRCRWWHRLTRGRQRPNPGYAQPSARYLKLLKDGAREHGLPDVYQQYLASLQPYTATHRRQKAGQLLFLTTWAPLLVFFLTMTNVLADETGKLPTWLASCVTGSFNLMWLSYDAVFKPIFGDGERTTAGPPRSDKERVPLLSNGHGPGP
ncbi:gliotoxin biosynthesis protein GliK [Drechmeria coniospora]|uniref:gamma-glutamylcyclotransferase n=1 Tax=Drechmeria coniospora TaxID=98403 RepID=A0A151GPL0_DRECN|nr:gliotoxin biosynthesis protein GliK [Drechmeria coniospora]KYK59047.1 gliotoxin biosynthesis protein GliK [Drechmeria coniospora]